MRETILISEVAREANALPTFSRMVKFSQPPLWPAQGTATTRSPRYERSAPEQTVVRAVPCARPGLLSLRAFCSGTDRRTGGALCPPWASLATNVLLRNRPSYGRCLVPALGFSRPDKSSQSPLWPAQGTATTRFPRLRRPRAPSPRLLRGPIAGCFGPIATAAGCHRCTLESRSTRLGPE